MTSYETDHMTLWLKISPYWEDYLKSYRSEEGISYKELITPAGKEDRIFFCFKQDPPIHSAFISVNFISTSQIANNLRLISNLQHKLSEHPPSSPCCEEHLVILCSDGTAAKVQKFVFWSTQLFHHNQPDSKHAISQYRLSNHPPLPPCCHARIAGYRYSILRWPGSLNLFYWQTWLQ